MAMAAIRGGVAQFGRRIRGAARAASARLYTATGGRLGRAASARPSLRPGPNINNPGELGTYRVAGGGGGGGGGGAGAGNN